MVRLTNRERIDRNKLLYDPQTLAQMRDRHGSTPLEVKMGVETNATVYEIRTAIRFWFGGSESHRTSERVWKHCEAFETGQWELDSENNIIDASEPRGALQEPKTVAELRGSERAEV